VRKRKYANKQKKQEIVQTEEEQEETENEEEDSLKDNKRPKITNQNDQRMTPDEPRAEAGPVKGGSRYRQMQAILN
jgi:hypothetical protein